MRGAWWGGVGGVENDRSEWKFHTPHATVGLRPTGAGGLERSAHSASPLCEMEVAQSLDWFVCVTGFFLNLSVWLPVGLKVCVTLMRVLRLPPPIR